VRKNRLTRLGAESYYTLGWSFHTRQLSVHVFRLWTFWNETDTQRACSKAHHVYDPTSLNYRLIHRSQ